MTIKEYSEIVAAEFSKRINKEVKPTARKKNNGVLFYGVEIIETSTINSIFYLNNLFSCNESVEDAVDRLCIWFEELKGERLQSYQWLQNFNLVKDKLCFKLVNKEQNEFLMQDYVCEEFLDLLKVYIINISELPENIQRGSIMIEKRLLELWDVTENEVKELADKNSQNILPSTIAKMADVIKLVAQSNGLEIKEEAEEQLEDSKLWVMTNQYSNDGAACMCYTNDLKEFANAMDDDIYILPCSVHELILLPASEVTIDYLKELVCETNSNKVTEEEILSNNVYLFSRGTEKVEIV